MRGLRIIQYAHSLLRGALPRPRGTGVALSTAPFAGLVSGVVARFGAVLDDTGPTLELGVLAEHRLALFGMLCDFARSARAELTTSWPPALPVARWRQAARAQSFAAHSLRLHGHCLDVTFWRTTPTAYVSMRDRPGAKKVFRDCGLDAAFTPGHLLRLSTLHGTPIDAAPRFDVDLVYTWVDGQDPAWRRMLAGCAPEADQASARPALFRNIDELKFSMRSLAYAPWVRRVFLVTNCAPPPWLNLESPRLQLVHHGDLLPAAACPTFNSHAIEACLHRIPGLAEHFLYLNDDMFFLNATTKADFFLSNGVSRSFLEPYGLVVEQLPGDAPDYLLAARNGKRLLEARFGASPTQLHRHVPYALCRGVLEELERNYPSDFHATQHSRFRSPSDISVPSFLYHHYAFHTRYAIRSSISAQYVIKASDWRDRIRRVRRHPEGKVLCVNDSDHSHVGSTRWTDEVTRMLEALFPGPSEFERVPTSGR